MKERKSLQLTTGIHQIYNASFLIRSIKVCQKGLHSLVSHMKNNKYPGILLAYLTILMIMVVSCAKDIPKDIEAKALYNFQQATSYPEFSGERALELVAKQLEFGPRAPNSEAHANCRAYFESFFTSNGAKLTMQDFSLPAYEGERLQLTNVIARFSPESKIRIILAAHWDSRPRADMESNEDDKSKAIPGANDGASGVAVLMHMAEIFARTPPPIGVDIILFDGEDYGREGDEAMYCLGAKYFSSSVPPEYDAQFGILLDLVGDKDAQFYREEYSQQLAGDIVDLMWNNAKSLGLNEFVDWSGGAILDDHVSLNLSAGIKTINIIDIDLIGHKSTNERRKYWHTLDDTIDNLSAETLGNVGKLLCYTIYGLRPV
jgi:peptidase M28-like protein